VHIISLKTFHEKLSCKTHKEKEYNVMHHNGIVQRASPPEPYKSLRLFIPMYLTHLSNIVKGNDLVNKFS
jgi:hypothetical protein